MQAFSLADLLAQRATSGERYLEFLRVPELSMGLYTLPLDGADEQSPHTEGEVYYIISGHAQIAVSDEVRPVGPGDMIYVPALAEHQFFDISEKLTALVFFAPAEGTA